MYNYIYLVYFKGFFTCVYEYKTKKDLLKNWPINTKMVKGNILNNVIKIYRKQKKNFGYYSEIDIYKFYGVKKCELEKMK